MESQSSGTWLFLSFYFHFLVEQTLGIVLTSEENRFFLYTMEVSEEDFAALRQDQGILVDFASFPSEIIGLLQACISSCSVAGQK